MSESNEALTAALEEAFAVAQKLYAERGFQRRVGFGRKPALIKRKKGSITLFKDDWQELKLYGKSLLFKTI